MGSDAGFRVDRYKSMSVDMDWTNMWPTKAVFKASAVPLPVNMGKYRYLLQINHMLSTIKIIY